MNQIFENKISIIIFGLIVLSLVMLCIQPPEFFFAKRSGDFAAQFMLGLLTIGLVALGFNKKEYMLISFLGSAIIAFFLKNESNANLVLPSENASPKITIAHFNTSDIESDFDNLIAMLFDLDVDLISVQEVTPDWNMRLKERFKPNYRYDKSIVRIDPFGMAIYSKTPLMLSEIFEHERIPNLNVALSLGGKKVDILSSYILPPFSKSTGIKAKEHLKTISKKINSIDNAIFSVGDFNLVYWSNEIRTFREDAQLQNSRRTIPINSLEVPHNHIFYSDALECVFFQELRGENQNRIGIVGTYQFKDLSDL